MIMIITFIIIYNFIEVVVDLHYVFLNDADCLYNDHTNNGVFNDDVYKLSANSKTCTRVLVHKTNKVRCHVYVFFKRKKQ